MKYQIMLINEHDNVFWYCSKTFKSIEEAKNYYFAWGVAEDIAEFVKNCEVRECDLSVYVVNENLSTEDFFFCEEVLYRA